MAENQASGVKGALARYCGWRRTPQHVVEKAVHNVCNLRESEIICRGRRKCPQESPLAVRRVFDRVETSVKGERKGENAPQLPSATSSFRVP